MSLDEVNYSNEVATIVHEEAGLTEVPVNVPLKDIFGPKIAEMRVAFIRLFRRFSDVLNLEAHEEELPHLTIQDVSDRIQRGKWE
jgi:hypothetical protein